MAEEVTRRLRPVCALYKQQVWLASVVGSIPSDARALACSGCRFRAG